MSLIDLTSSNFESTITDNSVVVVDFWASWCGPCRAFAPVFDRSAASHLGAMPAAALEDLITRVKALDVADVRAKIAVQS